MNKNRYIIIIIMLFILLHCFYGCTSSKAKLVSLEKSKSNFKEYHKTFEQILQPFGYILTEDLKNTYGESLDYIKEEYSINIDPFSHIELSVENGCGSEVFYITYCHKFGKIDHQGVNMDLSLFVDLCNSISGHQIEKLYINKFLVASENDYPLTNIGATKKTGEVIAKSDNINFWQDWSIVYYLYSDGTEKLKLYGLTKASTK